MKKYLLTALLGVFGICSFTYADTVDGYTSDTEICVYNMSDVGYIGLASEDYSCSDFVYSDFDNPSFYLCSSVSSIPYAIEITATPYALQEITTSNYCFSQEFTDNDDQISFYDDTERDNQKFVSGKLYFSKSPITYSAPSGGNGGNSGGLGGLGNNGGILSGGFTTLGNVLSGLSTTINEFIPYMVYIGLGILIVTLGFIAVKWLVNRVSKRVTSIFSSKRRK